MDPKDIERVESGKGRNGGDQKSAAPPNPAALAAMQVAQSRGQAGDKPSKDGAIAKVSKTHKCGREHLDSTARRTMEPSTCRQARVIFYAKL